VLDVSVTKYPVTPTLSEAMKLLIGTVSVLDVAGMTNPVTVGGVVSAGSAIVTEALKLDETLPPPSLAHAYKVFVPAVAKVYEVGAVVDHPAAPAEGEEADSVTR
jgi:hypothetical protein